MMACRCSAVSALLTSWLQSCAGLSGPSTLARDAWALYDDIRFIGGTYFDLVVSLQHSLDSGTHLCTSILHQQVYRLVGGAGSPGGQVKHFSIVGGG